MKLAADLHIHSCLSPCANEDMTPNNIVNMSVLKGLDVIAVSDHNSAKNLPAVAALAKRAGILFLPAIEVQTREEVHVLAYLPSVEAALELGETIRNTLLPIPNREDLFGPQIIMDENDVKIGREERLLLQPADLSIDELVRLVKALGGAAVPAHINRRSYSIIHALGFIPPNVFNTLEISTNAPVCKADTTSYHLIFNSDAHDLWEISERCNMIWPEERSIEAIIRYINRPLRTVFRKDTKETQL
ncbi:MAG: hypothetical protein ACOYIR_05385 [Christensenellales bacterium]|jgi:PHP family Zn ribbon phosphoesterase